MHLWISPLKSVLLYFLAIVPGISKGIGVKFAAYSELIVML